MRHQPRAGDMMNPPSKVDDQSDTLARLESLGKSIADQYGCVHFRYESLHREIVMYRFHRECNFPADKWEDPVNIDGIPYQKGTKYLDGGFRLTVWKRLT